jgi:hypothetical protein
VADYLPSVANAWVVPFDADLAQLEEPTVYWVDGGMKMVTVSVKPPNKNEMFGSGNVNIRRPVIDMWSDEDEVRLFTATTVVGDSDFIGFGNARDKQVANRHIGIQFWRTADATAAPGVYGFLQLVDQTAYYEYGNGDHFTRTSNGFVLDNGAAPADFIYPDVGFRTTNDSPSEGLGDKTYFDRTDRFKMYVMWKFGTRNSTDSIWVSLRVTNWGWWANVRDDGAGGWDYVGDGAAEDSQDTSELPEWSHNAVPWLLGNVQFGD